MHEDDRVPPNDRPSADNTPSEPNLITQGVSEEVNVAPDLVVPAEPDAAHDASYAVDSTPELASQRGTDHVGSAPPARPHAKQAASWFRPSGTPRREVKAIDRRLATALLAQGVVASLVLGYWVLGKAAWNHDPLVSPRFKVAELSVLSNRPLNAALEFHHDLTTGQFGQARLLAAADAEPLVTAAEERCKVEAADAPCRSSAPVYTRSTLLRSLGQEATAHVASFTPGDVMLSEATYELSRASGKWLVLGHAPEVHSD